MNDIVSLKTKQQSWPTCSIDKILSGDFKKSKSGRQYVAN